MSLCTVGGVAPAVRRLAWSRAVWLALVLLLAVSAMPAGAQDLQPVPALSGRVID